MTVVQAEDREILERLAAHLNQGDPTLPEDLIARYSLARSLYHALHVGPLPDVLLLNVVREWHQSKAEAPTPAKKQVKKDEPEPVGAAAGGDWLGKK